MAYTATATVTTVAEIAAIQPEKPITGTESQAQFEAAKTAAAVVATGTGPWTVTISGDGMLYPTSRVVIEVATHQAQMESTAKGRGTPNRVRAVLFQAGGLAPAPATH